MRYIFLTFILLGFFCSFSQTGNYFLSHYSPGEDRFDNVCFDMVQGDNGTMYFATRKGVQTFDGRNWDLISGNGAIYSLQLFGGEVYWSGTAGFGKITNADGSQQLEKLSPAHVSDVFQSIQLDDKLYFVTEKQVLNAGKDSIRINATSLTGYFLGIFELFGAVYTNTEKGIFKIEGDKLIRPSFLLEETDEVIFSCGYQNKYILGLASGKIYRCSKDLQLTELSLEDQVYADASVIISGSWVNVDLFVLGTLRGGMIFIQPSTGKTKEIINYSTGLPDNEVFTLMSDKSQCIWAAHEYGFTRVAPYLPLRSFNHYSGLSGNLLCALTFNNTVYVGTSLGLFKLEREQFFDEITYFVDVEIQPAKKNKVKQETKEQSPTTTNAAPPETESKRRGFLRFLKRNRETPPSDEQATDDTVNPEPTKEQAQFRKEKRVDKVLRSSHYLYKKVQGIDAKVNQLMEISGQLVAVGLGGAYIINDLQAQPLLQEPVRTAFVSKSREMLITSTYADEVMAFYHAEAGWQKTDLFRNLKDQINAMVEGSGNELWFYALDKAYRLDVSATSLENIQTIDIENPTFDEVSGTRWRNEIVLVNSEGFFRFNRSSNVFVRIDSLQPPTHYFTADTTILYSDSHTWSLIGIDNKQSNLQLLNLFNNPRFISADLHTDDLWIITDNNELYKFFGERLTPNETGFPPTLKSIQNGGDKIYLAGKLKFEVEKSSLSFEVVQPDYLAAKAIEYRYQLSGLGKSWSAWSSNNNEIEFPYLPAGDYTLLVQSRDIFGKVKDLDEITFEVLPPYWKRTWFYALEFFVFASLVLLSFRLSTRYRFVSRLLSLLTIIMLIQFIQTVIGEVFETRASPVIDFFMQVLVAFIILPVEGYLRNLMLRSLDSRSGVYKFLVPKAGGVQQEVTKEE